jgi:predicted ATPase
MQYLKSFTLPTDADELEYLLTSKPGKLTKLDMQCYSNQYPFGIFPHKRLSKIEFEPITLFYGGNGSGKSTLLNVIAEKLCLSRTAPFNNSPIIDDYIKLCEYRLGSPYLPDKSSIITSDGVFDYLLDIRAINEGIDRRREELLREYDATVKSDWQMKSLDDYEELRRRNEARRGTKSQYVTRRMKNLEYRMHSNGESAFAYFTNKIDSNALYLLDEPENSLSAKLQKELAAFLEEAVRFYGCQLVISTHSPFILSLRGAKIYDLDGDPAGEKHWSELENIRAYYDLFEERRREFQK